MQLASPLFRSYNVTVMAKPQVDVTQLKRRDPAAWTALLQARPQLQDEVVTAVNARPLYKGEQSTVIRYQLMLTGHSDPVTVIGKQTNAAEVHFYKYIAPQLGIQTPPCWHAAEQEDGSGWLVLADVPNHFPPVKWTAVDTEAVIHRIARQHIQFHNNLDTLHQAGLPQFLSGEKVTRHELNLTHHTYFEEGPAAILSDHAIESAGELAPTLLKAANGLAVIRSLGGWPGILGESHMAAAADLLDDPLPMLSPLKDLPATLLHGNQHTHHWRLTLFDDYYLIDWQKAAVGPGICDMVNFLEQFDLLYQRGTVFPISIRTEGERPLSFETMLDTYLLAMHRQLGSTYDTRQHRQAVPAARCLYVLLNWFPLFADWFKEMPSKYTWQKINRMSDEQLADTPFYEYVRFRPYLAGVFGRFLRAYYTL